VPASIAHVTGQHSYDDVLPLMLIRYCGPGLLGLGITALVAGFQLCDRIGVDPQPAIAALGSTDSGVAERAQWALVEAGPSVLPAVRKALRNSTGLTKQHLIMVLAWQADPEAIPVLKQLEKDDPGDRDELEWAIAKIRSLNDVSADVSCCAQPVDAR